MCCPPLLQGVSGQRNTTLPHPPLDRRSTSSTNLKRFCGGFRTESIQLHQRYPRGSVVSLQYIVCNYIMVEINKKPVVWSGGLPISCKPVNSQTTCEVGHVLK